MRQGTSPPERRFEAAGEARRLGWLTNMATSVVSRRSGESSRGTLCRLPAAEEILVLQGSPLLGAAFAFRHPAAEQIGTAGDSGGRQPLPGGARLRAQRLVQSDRGSRRPQQGRRGLHGQRCWPHGDGRSRGIGLLLVSLAALQPPRPDHALHRPGHRRVERALLPAPVQLERPPASQLGGPSGGRPAALPAWLFAGRHARPSRPRHRDLLRRDLRRRPPDPGAPRPPRRHPERHQDQRGHLRPAPHLRRQPGALHAVPRAPAFLALQGILPRALAALIVLYPLHLRWSLQALAERTHLPSICRLQSRYRALYAVVGVAMVAALWLE